MNDISIRRLLFFKTGNSVLLSNSIKSAYKKKLRRSCSNRCTKKANFFL